MGGMMDSELQAAVAGFRWFHQIDFGGGVISPGVSQYETLRTHADIYFRDDLLQKKSFLDIGCWDGFNSIEAYRRGASRVLATDHYAWSGRSWGDRRAFDLARRELAPDIEALDIDLPFLFPNTVGVFDVVLFAGVFYHLRHPFSVLENVSRLVRECLIVETHIDATDVDRPAMIFYPSAELNGDSSNWWGPNPACVAAMMKDVGFRKIDFTPSPLHPHRAIFHGWK